ncbi:prostaglandin reductase 1-like [Ostrea edulis]|uniref:prostaglandin reductase 1-like n=1 Tax=Ostrea edulis TaxID=37623 RepID=UPI0024AF7A8A|nr:prostaglandin reductase 1-like [Ostrea edulis]
MVLCKKWIYAKTFTGAPEAGNFTLETEELPDQLKHGEVLCEAVFLSVDPYMRLFPVPVGSVMMGEQVARISKSENTDYPVGTYVKTMDGWKTHTLYSDASKLTKVQDLGDLPKSLALGALGLPGLTAYFGFLEGCCPKSTDTVFVNSAAGAVGMIVGQIAKIKGCKVVGSAGSDEKCKWLKESLGFDEVFNYKTKPLEAALNDHAPNGLDCFFDNVGGEDTTIVIKHMNKYGRTAICGAISQYNKSKGDKGELPYSPILMNLLRVEGIQIMNYVQKWPEGLKQMSQWINEGKIKYKETVTEGFENMVSAFIGLFSGQHVGKAIVKP